LRDDIRRVRQYELMTIFTPEISEEDLQVDIDRVGDIISTAGGTVTLINRESPWGRRRLAYPIRHGSRDIRDGYYVLYYADIDTQSVATIERDLRLLENLMRYLVTQQVAEAMIPQSELEATEAAAAEASAETLVAPEGETAEELVAAEAEVEAPETAEPQETIAVEEPAEASVEASALGADVADETPAESGEPADETPAESGEPADETPAESGEAADETPAETDENAG
jgi:small subunit ribosomal protein S6